MRPQIEELNSHCAHPLPETFIVPPSLPTKPSSLPFQRQRKMRSPHPSPRELGFGVPLPPPDAPREEPVGFVGPPLALLTWGAHCWMQAWLTKGSEAPADFAQTRRHFSLGKQTEALRSQFSLPQRAVWYPQPLAGSWYAVKCRNCC